MNKHLLLLLSIVSFSCFAATPTQEVSGANCPPALSTNDPGFCTSFKKSAVCYCVSMGLPSSVCQDMQDLNARMISMFGSLERACAFQKNTSQQTCIDDWNCYLNGDEDSSGRLCSSTGDSCV